MMSRQAYQQTLPRKRMAAGCLLLDEQGRLLLVQPHYRQDGWLVPGGVVEAHESPLAACRRELWEEVGLAIDWLRLLCVDYRTGSAGSTESLQFLFAGSPLTVAQCSQIRLQVAELAAYRFVPLREAVALLVPPLGRRVAACVVGEKLRETAVYLENQRPVC